MYKLSMFIIPNPKTIKFHNKTLHKLVRDIYIFAIIIMARSIILTCIDKIVTYLGLFSVI